VSGCFADHFCVARHDDCRPFTARDGRFCFWVTISRKPSRAAATVARGPITALAEYRKSDAKFAQSARPSYCRVPSTNSHSAASARILDRSGSMLLCSISNMSD
jgi:hypothetical protein